MTQLYKQAIATVDGRTTVVCLDAAGQVRPLDEPFHTLAGDFMAPPFHIHCFPGDTRVSGPELEGATRRAYSGQVVKLETRSGNRLTGTPNHPVLTTRGWVPLGQLVEGDRLVRSLGHERLSSGRPNDENPEPRIHEIADALTVSSGVLPVRVPESAEDFHGDGIPDGYVDVVRPDGTLWEDGGVARSQHLSQSRLVGVESPGGLTRFGEPFGMFTAIGLTSARSMCGGGSAIARDAIQTPRNGGDADAETIGDVWHRLSGDVTADDVLIVKREAFHGEVFNLSTAGHWYLANGFIVHNCRTVVALWVPGMPGKQREDATRELSHRTDAEIKRALDGKVPPPPTDGPVEKNKTTARAAAPEPGWKARLLSEPTLEVVTYLRTGKPLGEAPEPVRAAAGQIDAAIASSKPLKSNRQVYRAIDNPRHLVGANAATGMIISDPAYGLASRSRADAETLAGGSGVVLIVTLPKGYHVADADGEVVIPRNARMQITSDRNEKVGGHTSRVWRATVIG